MKQEFVTLPRELVEQALKVLEYAANDVLTGRNAATALRAALEQPHTTEQSYMGCVTSDMHELAEWLHTMYEDAKEQIAALEQPQVEQEICCKIWSVNRIDDLGKIVDSSGRLIATVYGSQADKIVACHNSYTQQRHKREPLENEQARRIYNSATYSASLAVFMTRIDAEHPDADDKGVSGWLQEAEDRVKHRTIDAAHDIGQAAAPQQGEQEPVAWLHQCNKRPDLIEMSFSKREPTLASKGYKARPLIFGDIAHPQPKREPLTVEQIAAATGAKPGTPTWPLAVAFTRSIEAAHNIK